MAPADWTYPFQEMSQVPCPEADVGVHQTFDALWNRLEDSKEVGSQGWQIYADMLYAHKVSKALLGFIGTIWFLLCSY